MLKEVMTTALVLALLDFSQPFEVETDASSHGVGAMLSQHGHPIAYLSKALSAYHRRMSVYERELYAILFAVKKWGHFLQTKPFIVKIDH